MIRKIHLLRWSEVAWPADVLLLVGVGRFFVAQRPKVF